MSAPYRLGPKPAPLTPRATLAHWERLLTAALLELGALESDPAPWITESDHRWRVLVARETVASIRAKRDLAALSLDREVIDAQLSELPAGWRPRVERDAGPSMEVVK